MLRLEGKNALITGATTGIGQAIAIRFAQEGANVAINYRTSPDEAEATKVSVEKACFNGGHCKEITVRADISKEDQVRGMFSEVISEFGTIDILVNNAGIQKPAASHEVDILDFDNVVGVNLRGAFLCAREAIRHFLARGGGGVILNNSSVHEIIPKPKYSAVFHQQGRHGEHDQIARAGIRGARHSRERGWTGRRGYAHQQRLDRRSGGSRGGGEPHSHGTRGAHRRDRLGVCVPRVRRSFVHHWPDHFRVRRFDALSRISRGLVFGRIGGAAMLFSLKRHWPEYLMEAAALGLFMISACTFGVLLDHPSSSASSEHREPATSGELIGGVAMGLTAIATYLLTVGPTLRRAHESGGDAQLSIAGQDRTAGTRCSTSWRSLRAGSRECGWRIWCCRAGASPLVGELRGHNAGRAGCRDRVLGRSSPSRSCLMSVVLTVSNSKRLTRFTPLFVGAAGGRVHHHRIAISPA